MATLTNIHNTVRFSIDLVERGGQTPIWIFTDFHTETKNINTDKWQSIYAIRRESLEEIDILTLMESLRTIIDGRGTEFTFLASRGFAELGISTSGDSLYLCTILMDMQWEYGKTVLDERALYPSTLDLTFHVTLDEIIKFTEAFEEEFHICLH